ncbi:hypothetical protein RRSWK_00021 [Rhodopirellula sp. SWK7]|nr:hypothetical protein RRSWK_00021 [Rhodopirellula sp. SWK7]
MQGKVATSGKTNFQAGIVVLFAKIFNGRQPKSGGANESREIEAAAGGELPCLSESAPFESRSARYYHIGIDCILQTHSVPGANTARVCQVVATSGGKRHRQTF